MLKQRKEESETVEDKSIPESSSSKSQENKLIQIQKMESSNDSFQTSELIDKNWKYWLAKMEPYLDLQGLWDVVKNDLPAEAEQNLEWKKKDRKTLNLIKMRVSDKLFDITMKCKHARDAFQQLKERFEGSGSFKMVMLLDRMFHCRNCCRTQFHYDGNCRNEIEALR